MMVSAADADGDGTPDSSDPTPDGDPSQAGGQPGGPGAQPGMGQPGMGQPGMPGMGQPGMGQPMGQPGAPAAAAPSNIAPSIAPQPSSGDGGAGALFGNIASVANTALSQSGETARLGISTQATTAQAAGLENMQLKSQGMNVGGALVQQGMNNNTNLAMMGAPPVGGMGAPGMGMGGMGAPGMGMGGMGAPGMGMGGMGAPGMGMGAPGMGMGGMPGMGLNAA